MLKYLIVNIEKISCEDKSGYESKIRLTHTSFKRNFNLKLSQKLEKNLEKNLNYKLNTKNHKTNHEN